MAQVRITDSSGTERATLDLVSLQKPENLDELTRAQIGVKRDDLDGVSNLTPGEDRVFVEDPAGNDTFGGILRTPGRGGSVPLIIGDSFGRYMDYAEGTDLGSQKTGAFDDTLIDETVDATPQLSKGTINRELGSGRTWVFSGISQLAKARKVAEVAGAEVVFQPDLTVDYGATQHGSDKTGTTLSPANNSFAENTFKLDEDGFTGNVTHLSVYGVGQGSGQLEATVVPSDDSASYPNKVTYTNNDWTSGDDKRWDRRTNKDIKRVDPLQDWGTALIGDLQETETRVETVVKGTDVALGDEFTVANPDEGLSATTLRAVEVTKIIDPQSGTKYKCVFSNHNLGRRNYVAEKDKLQGRYEQAYEGDLVQLEKGPGRGPVDSSHDYIISVFYPSDVIQEIRAELKIKGLNYRSYIGGVASHSHTVSDTSTSTDNSEFASVAEQSSSTGFVNASSGSWNTIDSYTPSSNTSAFYVHSEFLHDQTGNETIEFRFRNNTTGYVFPSSPVNLLVGEDESEFLFAVDATNVNGETLQVQARPQSDIGISSFTYWIGTGPHNHDVSISDTSSTAAPLADPGIQDWDGSDQSPAHYPENVDVVVNNSSEGTSFGDGTGEFDATHDLSGALSSGWNTIALTSDGIGHLDASFSADLVRQSL